MSHQFAIDYYRVSGEPLGRLRVAPDWEPALEAAVFEGMRRDLLPAVSHVPGAVVEPVWHRGLGAPYVESLQAKVALPTGDAFSLALPTAYLRPLAEGAAARLVGDGRLASGDSFRYLVCALDEQEHQIEPSDGIEIHEVVHALPLDEAPLAPRLVDSEIRGPATEGEMPVLVPARVLDQAIEMARGAGEVETAGILLGVLHRDRSQPEIFLEVTELVAAPHTLAGSHKVTFTADTWTAVDAAIGERADRVIMVGWMHSHICWCRGCPAERRARCSLSRPFFSADDVHLHRAVFGRAYQIALLVSDTIDAGLVVSLFGWRLGMVQERSLRLIHRSRSETS